MMNRIDDTLLIKWYIEYCSKEDMSQTQMAKNVGRTKSWASRLVHDQIHRLNFTTRNRIKACLGIQ